MIIKEIPGFPGYGASADGAIWSCVYLKILGFAKGSTSFIDYDNWRPMKRKLRKDGYLEVQLRKDKKPYFRRVHVLILETFIGPRPYKYVVAHANGVKADNRLENLRWTTQKDNINDAKLHGTWTHGEMVNTCKLTPEQVLSVRNLYIEGISRAELARRFEVSWTSIDYIIKGKNWAHLS